MQSVNYLHWNVETEHPDGADDLGHDLQRHRPSCDVPNQLDDVIQHLPCVHPHLRIGIGNPSGRELAGSGARSGGAEQMAAVRDGGGDGAVSEREEEPGISDAEAEREVEIQRRERGRVDAEAVEADVGDAGCGSGRVEEEREAGEEREDEEERERAGAEAAYAWDASRA
jgi:hypothetical protein